MTQQEFERRLLRAVEKAKQLIESLAPERSGKLKMSIKLVATAQGYDIEITAPHMVYTEEKWTSPQWRGRANPNEGWFAQAVELAYRLIKLELNATGSLQGQRS